MSAALEKLAELIRRRSGISLGPTRMPALAAAVARVAPQLSLEEVLERAGDAGVDPLLDLLVDEVTINETFFFRHRQDLDAIDWPGLAQVAARAGRQRIRVWSAACSTGEEAYSLAILASEAFGTRSPPVTVLGTDISPTALEAARRGRYRLRAVAHIDEELRRRYFETDGAEHAVDGGLRALVDFTVHNLVGDPAPPPGEQWFDLILCRNVLIYFDAGAVETTIRGLEGSLEPGGTLILGTADRLCDSRRGGRAAPPGTAADDRRRSRGAKRTGSRRHRRRGTPVATRAIAATGPPAIAARLPGPAPASSRRDLRMSDGPNETPIEDPLDPAFHFCRGVSELEAGDARLAIVSLRRALYLEPASGLAAFQLGQAHEALGHDAAARRAYEQALRTLEINPAVHGPLEEEVDPGDVAAACQARLGALAQRAAGLKRMP